MEKEILEHEQQQFLTAQTCVDTEINSVLERIGTFSKDLKEKLEYAVNEKIDDIELLEAFGDINTTDKRIADMKTELYSLQKVRPKPFFARIDINGRTGEKSYYIGLKNLKKDDAYFVLDWRAPISSLFYYSSLGKVSYIAPAGKIEVDLTLKRQFRTVPNKIVSYIDTNTKIDDQILQEVLSENSSAQMTNIVQTIQEEQNQIIRKNPKQTVIINGIAGSGKTSIAMHRIAYILFANKGNIKSENILIISPNMLFGKYIENVLPELGEENVPTYTMMQLFNSNKLTPKSYGTKADMVEDQLKNNVRKISIDFKFSNKFKHIVDEYLSNLNLTPYFKKITINGSQISDEELSKTIIDSKTFDFTFKITKVFESIIMQRYPKVSPSNLDKVVQKLVAKFKKLFSTTEIMADIYAKNKLSFGEKSKFGFEDAPIYAYINSFLNGVSGNYVIKHIFVDEMQDYDPFTISLLKKLYPDAVMTLVGDYNQNITSSQCNLESLMENFPNTSVDTLDVSYRSTHEITNFANQVLKKDASPTKLIRHGTSPTVIQLKTDFDLEKFAYKILSEDPKKRVAILTKTKQEAEYLAEILKDFVLIQNESDPNLLTHPYIISTIYLSKGLEYDKVIVFNTNKENFSNEMDKQNLYVACTRALHDLYITYDNEPSPLIPQEHLKKNKNLTIVNTKESKLNLIN